MDNLVGDQSPFSKEQLINYIMRVNSALTQQFNRNIQKRAGLSFAKFEALAAIKNSSKEYFAMSDLSEELKVSNANITGMVQRLEIDGFLTKNVSPIDRRVSYLSLTKKGEQILQASFEKMSELIDEIIPPLKNEEVGAVRSFFKNIEIEIEKNS